MPVPRRAKKATKIGAAATVEARKRPAISTQPEESSKVSKGLDEEEEESEEESEEEEEEEEEEDYKFECRHLRIERFQLVQENGRLAQSNAAHELKVRALSQDVERLEVTTVWEFALGFTNAIDARRRWSNSHSISRIGKSEAMTKKCCIKVCSSITATKTRSIVYCCHSK